VGLALNTAVAIADNLDPETLVRQTSDRMLVVLKEQHDLIQAEPERLYGLVDDIVLPHFDFERMARWVLGKHWKRASPDQQQRFVNEFRTLLVRTYGTALLEYRDQRINFLPLRMAEGSEDVTVRTEVVKPGGVPIPISYSMFRGRMAGRSTTLLSTASAWSPITAPVFPPRSRTRGWTS